MGASNGLRQDGTDINHLQFRRAGPLFRREWVGVGDDDFVDAPARLHFLQTVPALEESVGGDDVDAFGAAVLHQVFRRRDKGRGGVAHVVADEGGSAVDVPDEGDHAFVWGRVGGGEFVVLVVAREGVGVDRSGQGVRRRVVLADGGHEGLGHHVVQAPVGGGFVVVLGRGADRGVVIVVVVMLVVLVHDVARDQTGSVDFRVLVVVQGRGAFVWRQVPARLGRPVCPVRAGRLLRGGRDDTPCLVRVVASRRVPVLPLGSTASLVRVVVFFFFVFVVPVHGAHGGVSGIVRRQPRNLRFPPTVGVDQGKVDLERVRHARDPLRTPGVLRDDDHVPPAVHVLLDPPDDGRLGVEIVHGDLEEALHLGGVEVHRDDVVHPGDGQEVRDHLGGDTAPVLLHLALLDVGKVREDGRDARGTRSLAGGQQDQEFHEMVVDRPGSGLDDKGVGVPHRDPNLDRRLSIRELFEDDRGRVDPQPGTDGFREGRVG